MSSTQLLLLNIHFYTLVFVTWIMTHTMKWVPDRWSHWWVERILEMVNDMVLLAIKEVSNG